MRLMMMQMRGMMVMMQSAAAQRIHFGQRRLLDARGAHTHTDTTARSLYGVATCWRRAGPSSATCWLEFGVQMAIEHVAAAAIAAGALLLLLLLLS